MKKCNKCLEVKELSEFVKRSASPDGLAYNCKACNKQRMKQYYEDNLEKISERMKQYYQENVESISEYQKQWREENPEYKRQWKESLKDGYHHVYILPNHHYAGTTDCITNRMRQHKNDYGRNTDNYEIVGSYEKREDARAHESRLHDEGYNGRHINNCYK
jgi:hypothetical protein